MSKVKIRMCNDVSCKDEWVEESEMEEFLADLDKEISYVVEGLEE